jgi:hypothetical protein
MAEAAIKPPDDDVADATADAPAQPAPAAAAPGDQPDLDHYLKEFETGLSRPAAQPADQSSPATGAAPRGDIDAMLDDIARQGSGPGQSPLFTHGADVHQQLQAQEQFNSLQNENLQLRGHIQAAADQRDLDRLTGQLQSKLPDHLPPDYAATALKSMALDHPELVIAFDARHVNRAAIDRELRQVEQTLSQLQRNPNGADPQQIAELTQYGRRLGCMLNSREILKRATRAVIKAAEGHRPIDPEATAEHDAVAAAVRGQSGKAQPEPPPNFGNMSDKELSKYTREHFGF